jgi:hypothetical protein
MKENIFHYSSDRGIISRKYKKLKKYVIQFKSETFIATLALQKTQYFSYKGGRILRQLFIIQPDNYS